MSSACCPAETVREVRGHGGGGPLGAARAAARASSPGAPTPDHGFAVPRVAASTPGLVAAARDAGADGGAWAAWPVCAGPATAPWTAWSSTTGGASEPTIVIGADGATSRVAEDAGLVDPARVLWGFAVRVYLDEPAALPHIVLWEPEPGRAFPGYGWLFPGADGRANAGLGIGTTVGRAAPGLRRCASCPPSSTICGALGLVRGPRRRVGAGSDWAAG